MHTQNYTREKKNGFATPGTSSSASMIGSKRGDGN
jgi:hypothetical protein